MNVKELREAYPDIVAEIENSAMAKQDEAVKMAALSERKRMQEIDEVASLFNAEMVKEARYGETACNAQELSYRAAKEASKQGLNFLNALAVDTDNSQVKEVPSAVAKQEETPENTKAKEAAAIKELLK